MQKEWQSFKITLILYSIILVLPLAFYFVYTSFNTMREDTKVVRQTTWISAAMLSLTQKQNTHIDTSLISNIDNKLENISVWVTKNKNSNFYIGRQTILKDLDDVKQCWEAARIQIEKQNISAFQAGSLKCWIVNENLAMITEKMVYLKQNNIIDVFYASLLLAMLLVLITIYLVRNYIFIQLKKHAIYDHETKLYNKNYFISTLHASCSRSTRYNYPLSMVSITMVNCENGCMLYEKLTRAQLLTMFGGLILFLTRDADIACRYEGNTFFIILPDTDKEGSEILENRMRDALNSHDFRVTPKMEFSLSSIQFDPKLDTETFLEEAKSLASH